jgi:hypothetical protein
VTCTARVTEVNVGALAVMLAEPTFAPVICGAVVGCVAPAGIVTLVVDRLTLVESLVESVTVTPPTGAGAGKVTVKGMDCPRPTLRVAGRVIAPAL